MNYARAVNFDAIGLEKHKKKSKADGMYAYLCLPHVLLDSVNVIGFVLGAVWLDMPVALRQFRFESFNPHSNYEFEYNLVEVKTHKHRVHSVHRT